MKVEHFSKILFTTLSYKLIREVKCDILDENVPSDEKSFECLISNDVFSRSVLMLSYVYRPAFKKRYDEVYPILTRAKDNLTTYIRCFAEVLHEKYSPLKFLILCSFISESVNYISNCQILKARDIYIEQTTKALNDVFHRVFERDFPRNGWMDIRRKATKIAKGFKFLEPFMDQDYPDTTVIEVADAILTDKYELGKTHQQTNATMTEKSLDQTTSVIASHNELHVPISPNFVDIPVIKVSILSPEGLPTNQTAYLSQNPVYTTVINSGTADQVTKFSYLLHFPSHQNAVTFEDQPSEIDPNVSITSSSNGDLHNQENLLSGSLDNEAGFSFRAVDQVPEPSCLLPTPSQQNAVTIEYQHSGIDPFFSNASSSNGDLHNQENLLSGSLDNEAGSSFRAVDQVPEPSCLLHTPSQQNADPKFSNASSSNGDLHNQENLLSGNLDNEARSSFRTIRKTENEEDDTYVVNNEVISEQELIDGEKQFWETFFALDYKKETETYRQIVKEIENFGSENSIANYEISEQILIDANEQFLEDSLSSGTELKLDETEHHPQGFGEINESLSSGTEFKPNTTKHSSQGFGEINDNLSSGTELKPNTTEHYSQGFQEINENRREILSKAEDVNGLKRDTFSKENTLTTGNTLNVPGQQSEAFYQRQFDAALKDFETYEAVYSRKPDSPPANTIEVNFQTDENNPLARVLHLNLGGNHFVLRMPTDITLIFKYNGKNSSNQ